MLEAGRLDDAGFRAVAQLTALHKLELWQHRSATDAGLLHLTQLKQATELVVEKTSGIFDTTEVFKVGRPHDMQVRRHHRGQDAWGVAACKQGRLTLLMQPWSHLCQHRQHSSSTGAGQENA